MMARNADRRLLVVDDEVNFASSLALAIEDQYEVTHADSASQMRRMLSRCKPDVVLLDVRLPDANGTELVEEIRKCTDSAVVVMMTAYATVENAVAALKFGAADYFTKPLDIAKLKRELSLLLENRPLQGQVQALRCPARQQAGTITTARTSPMQSILEQVPKIAPLAIPVLITGETGTGKELLAQRIHALSGARGDIVAINCATIPHDIFESELFGHKRGAFSGAHADKEGFIERATDGTLFLDEIGELPDSIQAKLLRVLESGVYFKVGDTREHHIRFRLVAATHKDLTAPSSGFRRDLFFRINGIRFQLPPLRERQQDIPLLAAQFVEEANRDYQKAVQRIAPKAFEALQRYDWPGNIRELKWVVHRAVALARGSILESEDFGASPEIFESCVLPASAEMVIPSDFRKSIARIEQEKIAEAVATCGGNKTEAASRLGISLRTLQYKLRKYASA